MKDSATVTHSKKEELNPKGKNATYIWSFISINIAVFLWLLLSKGLTESSLDHFWKRVTMKDGIILAGVPLLAIVLSGVVGAVGKARLVFWRWRDPLPGSRVFSELIQSDPRIDVSALRLKLGEFPSDPRTQNSVWFKLYRQHSSVPRVFEAHKLYLLTRDMATIAALFAVLLSLAVICAPISSALAGLYAFVLMLQYALIATAARNYGTRFVLNVVAEELHG